MRTSGQTRSLASHYTASICLDVVLLQGARLTTSQHPQAQSLVDAELTAYTMARLPLLSALGAYFLLPTTIAHMQMIDPSPLRDPHANRPNEPKDYNMLTPLHADGSDFACKGYQWNTPWTSVATYEAGGTYNMTLKGGATHGGGSCQLSLSCDGGVNFKVCKSIVGGCPLQSQYEFTVPSELGRLGKTTCLLAWTWFNKVGNREMYMNCTVVDIVPPGTKRSKYQPSHNLAVRDTARVNAVAQASLATYSDMFVANLASINKCVAPETYDVVFDNPGRGGAVAFGDGITASSKPSFKRGACIGKGHTRASTSSDSVSAPPSGGPDPGGDDGQWHGGNTTPQPQSTGASSSPNDEQWHPELYGGQQTPSQLQQSHKAILQLVGTQGNDQQYDSKVKKELDAYLAELYGGKVPSKRMTRRNRWATYQSSTLPVSEPVSGAETVRTNLSHASGVVAVDPPVVDASLTAFLMRLSSLTDTLFTLVKYANTYLDRAPPAGMYGTAGVGDVGGFAACGGMGNLDYIRPKEYEAVQKRRVSTTEREGKPDSSHTGTPSPQNPNSQITYPLTDNTEHVETGAEDSSVSDILSSSVYEELFDPGTEEAFWEEIYSPLKDELSKIAHSWAEPDMNVDSEGSTVKEVDQMDMEIFDEPTASSGQLDGTTTLATPSLVQVLQEAFPSLAETSSKQSPPPTTNPDHDHGAAAILPYIMGHGPYVPPGVTIDWLTPGNPTVFGNLRTPAKTSLQRRQAPTPPPLPLTSSTPDSCTLARQTLRERLNSCRAQLAHPCGFLQNVRMPVVMPEMEDAMQKVCELSRERLLGSVREILEVLEGGCEEAVAFVDGV
ncbi:hypothetical protein BDW02DRAFT_203230 [Decorospora gaudefroyi]|uniref:Lytic polysaccharide monooxygenase n=1 Tax=Decorospora gaudefroyi TaxID=184978 RepID=A0A6A5KLA9_9PLEO|nr:hypothetical protein BDW02DRAFT_203230 [Decorospora gaudefroyi]